MLFSPMKNVEGALSKADYLNILYEAVNVAGEQRGT